MKVLALGAHPDDVEVGMGGTIAKYAEKGHEVLLVIATIPNNKTTREKEAKASAKVLGAQLLLLNLEPEEITFSRKLVCTIDHIIKDFLPDVVYTHWNHDSHQDHVAIANATIASTRKNNSSLYMYEQTIPGGIVPYGFKPQVFVDITDVIEKKIESIRMHKSQLKVNGDWWIYGARGRAGYRGYQINVKYAEAFEVVRHLEKIKVVK